jgi:hypothetical protein
VTTPNLEGQVHVCTYISPEQGGIGLLVGLSSQIKVTLRLRVRQSASVLACRPRSDGWCSGGALSDEKTRLSFATHSPRSSKSVVGMYSYLYIIE